MMKLFLNFAFAFTCGVMGGILVTWAELGPIPDWLLKEIMPKAKVNWDEAYEVNEVQWKPKLLPPNNEVKLEWKPKLLPPNNEVKLEWQPKLLPPKIKSKSKLLPPVVVKPQIKNEWEPKWLPFKKKDNEVKPEVKNEWKRLPPKKKRHPDLWPIFRDYPMMSHNFLLEKEIVPKRFRTTFVFKIRGNSRSDLPIADFPLCGGFNVESCSPNYFD